MSTPNPPFPTPAGQHFTWAYASTVWYGPESTGVANGSAIATTTTAQITLTQVSDSNMAWGAQWSGFSVPNLPSGSTVNSMFAVTTATLNTINADYSALGGGQGFNIINGANTGFGGNLPGSGVPPFSFTSATGVSVNLSPSYSLGEIQFGVCLSGSGGFIPPANNTFDVSFIAIGVYYTSPPPIFGSPISWTSVGNNRKPSLFK